MAKESPSLVHHKQFERGRKRRIVDDGIGPVQDIEKKRLQHLRQFTHPFEIELLELRECQRVSHVIEPGAVLSALRPLLKRLPKICVYDVRQRIKSSLLGLDF